GHLVHLQALFPALRRRKRVVVFRGGPPFRRSTAACSASQGNSCSVVLNRYGSWNSVRSPGFLPLTGCSRADSGLCHFHASEATSPKIFTNRSSLTSPGSGIVSSPVPHTDEYASSESIS